MNTGPAFCGAFFLKMNMKIAIQGVNGAFHEIAARQYFGADIETVNCDQFRDLFRAVEDCTADYGIVAIENTIAGSILENYLLLKRSKLKVIGELNLHITQNLMALPGTRIEDITEVYSHPIAIQQSKDFFDNYPNIKMINWSDTASAAQKVAERRPLQASMRPNSMVFRYLRRRFRLTRRTTRAFWPSAARRSIRLKTTRRQSALN